MPRLNFSEYGHVAYLIKRNDACSNMNANVLPTDTPLTPGEGSTVKQIIKEVMLHIK